MKPIRAIAVALLVAASSAAHADIAAAPSKLHPAGLDALEKNPKSLNLTVQRLGKTAHVTLALTANPTHFETKEVVGYMGVSKSGKIEPMQESVGLSVEAVPVAVLSNGALVVRLAVNDSHLEALKSVTLGDKMFQIPDISGVAGEGTLVVKEGEEVPVLAVGNAGKNDIKVLARLSGSGDPLPAVDGMK
ncbi:hypothetical protein [Ralstonia insidiosa]|jgi:hypothetical protein|nr:hypothetical protein [Ralstonia insidiosa]MBA9940539.1 hypothetical protein [Ralstonia insidiosa]MBC9969009.1 hypothetical protein [Ralstonia insidiosa]MBX3905091.1 hypothetical protein [Ralstonia insidiosa]